MTDNDKHKIIQGYIIDLWQRFLKGEPFRDDEFTSEKHDELYRLGILKETKGDEKKQLIKKAEDRWENYLKGELMKSEANCDRNAIKHFKRAVGEFKELLREPSTRRNVIYVYAKEIKLREFFEKCKANNVNLKKLIK